MKRTDLNDAQSALTACLEGNSEQLNKVLGRMDPQSAIVLALAAWRLYAWINSGLVGSFSVHLEREIKKSQAEISQAVGIVNETN